MEETEVVVNDTEQVDQTPAPVENEIESKAREQGWRPKEEWDGDPEKWTDAKEFVARGELFGKIDTMGRELKETRKALKMLQEHHTKVKETEYKRAVEELKALQKKHLESGDSAGYLETTEMLTDLKAEQKAREVIEETTQKPVDPRFVAWIRDNPWYSQSTEMRQYADAIGLGYAQSHPGIDPEDVLSYVASEVKQRYKNKFENPNRKKQSVEGATNTATAQKKESFDLSDDERRVMNTFVRQGIMTKEEYIAEVKKMRGGK